MKRKIVRHGPSSLTVSLPMKWAKQQGIKAGDEIEVAEKETELIISKEGFTSRKVVDIRLTKESERYARSYLGRLYRAGYTTINVYYEQPNSLIHVKNAVNNLLGADIVDADTKRCVVKIFPLDEVAIDAEKNLVKMLLTLKTMYITIIEDAEKEKFGNGQTIDELRHNNWKMRDLIQRAEHTKLHDPDAVNRINAQTFFYEKIGSSINTLYNKHLITKTKIDNKPAIIKAIKQMLEFIDRHIRSVSSKKPVPLTEIASIRTKAVDFNQRLLDNHNKEKNVDHACLSMLYLQSELLNSTLTYINSYEIDI
jgi:hypothetical protein